MTQSKLQLLREAKVLYPSVSPPELMEMARTGRINGAAALPNLQKVEGTRSLRNAVR